MRISVTDIDSWRYYKATEDMVVEELLRRLRKQEPPSRAMLAGRALHSVLEHAKDGDLDYAEADGFRFRFEADCALSLPSVRELKGEMLIPSRYGPVTLVGVVDGLDGAIYDHKLTARFDAERYADSYQWRCYLVMFGASKFIYNVFEGQEDEKRAEWAIRGFQQFTLYAYEGMKADVAREVAELADFVAQHVPEKLAA